MIDSLLVGGLELVVSGESFIQAQQADPGAFGCYVDRERNMLGCLTDEYTMVTGDALFGLVVGGCLLLALYVAGDGDLVVPAVITTLFGGALIPMLPGAYESIAMAIMLLGIIGAVFAVGVKYVVRGGV